MSVGEVVQTPDWKGKEKQTSRQTTDKHAQPVGIGRFVVAVVVGVVVVVGLDQNIKDKNYSFCYNQANTL